MAVKASSSQGHFLIRLAGLTGLVALVVGLVLWLSIGKALAGGFFLACGIVLVVSSLLVEIKGAVDLLGSRRGAVGANVVLQILLAVALLAVINVFSFFHYQRFDWTREAIFTIPEKLRGELSKLRGETDIIVYIRHTSFGQTGEAKQDNYDAAAERKIVEKVKDLAEQFQELGPRFRIEVLDIQEEGFQSKLTQIKAKSKDLAEAIEKAPENSIFFFTSSLAGTTSAGGVQRLAFHDIYQLDKEASRKANEERGNLVLNYQGIGPFARKILNIEEKKPRIALGVVHELLSFTDPREDRLTMFGAGKVLRASGFDTRDLILKKWTEMGPPEATVLTFDISRFEGLEEQRLEGEENVKILTKEVEELNDYKKTWLAPLEDLNKKLTIVVTEEGVRLMDQKRAEELKKSGQAVRTIPIDERVRNQTLQGIETQLAFRELGLKQEKAELDNVLKEQKNLNVEELSEQRRITDVQAKLSRQLADCDLLILPRQTILDLPRGDVIPNKAHRLDDAQYTAIKEFMKAGKPVLFCLGPINDSARGFDPSDLTPDQLEASLSEMGFKMPKQTILFNVESKSFAERRGGLIIMGTQVEVPPVEFDWKPGADLPTFFKSAKPPSEVPQSVRTSVLLTSRSVGKTPELELRLRYPRPIYFKPGQDTKQPFDVSLFMTSPDCWNEDQPFPTRERTPRFELPKKDDPNIGTVNERRRGPFPTAAAVETSLPISWVQDSQDKGTKVRLGVIGHGGAFVGKTLSVIQQKLLLDTCNWLLGRDDLLAHREETWQYPRVDLSEAQNLFWQWSTRLGMPLLFVYLGLVMWLIRRMR